MDNRDSEKTQRHLEKVGPIYCRLMEEIKHRDAAIVSVLDGKVALPSPVLCDLCYVELRKICPQLDQARGRLVDGVSVENEMQAVYSTGDRRSSSASSSLLPSLVLQRIICIARSSAWRPWAA